MGQAAEGIPGAIEAACYEANVDMMAKYDAKNVPALQRLVKSGVKLHQFSQDILRAAQKAAYELYEDEASKNPAWKKIYEPWKKFRSDHSSGTACRSSPTRASSTTTR
jgi:TRAP-type mannitol/chloroaromatic compound transport system substrate-binding protein